jgi:hypothetical protein
LLYKLRFGRENSRKGERRDRRLMGGARLLRLRRSTPRSQNAGAMTAQPRAKGKAQLAGP